MAHDDNGYIYVDSDTGTGISVAEVASVLNAQPGEGLCDHANIKKWAKYKPMAVGDMHGYTDAQAKLINYGLLVPYYTNYSNMIRDIDDNSWTRADNYESGKDAWQNNGLSAASWHRLLDFDHYLHSAVSPMATITMDKDSYAAYEMPEFITNAGGTSAYNIAPKDIRLILNGAIAQGGEDMYLGICVKSDAGRFYKIIGRCLTVGRGTLNIYDPDFTFPRVNAEQVLTACMFLSRDNLNNGQVGTNTDMTGYFIPLTMSRAILQPYFSQPELNFSYDHTSWHNPKPDGNTIFVIKCFPDSDYSWELYIYGEYTSGGAVHTVFSCEDILVPLHREYDSRQQQQDLYLRFETDRANAEMKFDLYACDSSSDHYVDVIAEDTSVIGQPIRSQVFDIVYGEILTDASAVGLMTRAMLVATYHDDERLSESCAMGTWPNA